MRPGHHRLQGLFGIQSACVAPRSRLRCAIVHDGAEMRTPPLNVHEVVGGQPLIVRHDELVIRIGRHAKAAGLEVDRQWQRRDRKHADASRYLWLLFLISGLAIGLFIGRIRGAALVDAGRIMRRELDGLVVRVFLVFGGAFLAREPV
jgi:hypothetical protein